jgi:hypothetical protein
MRLSRWKSAGTNVIDVRLRGVHHGFAKLSVLANKGRDRFIQTKSIVTHQHLPIAVRTRSYSNRRHAQSRRDFAGKIRGNRFQNDREDTGLLKRLRIGKQLCRRLFVACLLPKSEFVHGLWRQSKMSHNGDAVSRQPANDFQNRLAALDLYRRRAPFLDEPAGVTYRLFGGHLIGEKRHIDNNQGPAGAAGYRLNMMNHHVECYGNRVLKAEYDHSNGIPDKNHVDSGLVEQPRHRGIVGGKNGNLRSFALHLVQIGYPHRLHGYRVKDCATMLGKKMLVLPLAFTLALAAMAAFPPIRQNPNLLWAFLVAAIVVAAWNILLLAWPSKRNLEVEIVLRKQHYLQACAQGSVLLYWGWYWPQVYDSAPLLMGQLLFAYAFDMLLCWSRRETYTLGFGPFPVIFSINLFLWFKPDWFYLQFAMVALGLAAKELIRWNKDGRRTHIFNPSSFPLAVFSLILIATGSSEITWGREIATTQFYPPHMYLMLFLVGLPGQFFFGVTLMTMSAVVATYIFGLIYFATTGVYFFYDSYIPIAVFLGMHLLFTDPSTSPRTDLGRIIYGTLYGLSTVALYQILGSAGLPTFYDKLLQVPLLNLSIRGIDRVARSSWLRTLDPATIRRSLAPHQRHLAYMSVWAVVFVAMSAAQGVGELHPGQWAPFWRQACMDGRPYACPYLADLQLTSCNRGSAWACNEAGLMHVALSRSGEDLRRLDPAGAAELFRRGCDKGVEPACQNLSVLTTGVGRFASVPPTIDDYPIILRGSKGEIRERDPAALYAMACRAGWTDTCGLRN